MRSFQTSVLISSLALSIPTAAARIPHTATCGQAGYGGDTDAYFYDDENVLNTLLKCQKHCNNDSQCKSISFSKHTCMHYAVGVAGNFDTDSDSPFVFYDRTCYTPSSPVSIGPTRPIKSSTTVTTRKPSEETTAQAPSTTFSSSDTARKQFQSSSRADAPGKLTRLTVTTTILGTTGTTSAITATTSAPPAGPSTSPTNVPPGCNIPASYTVRAFNMFNSTHNLDCLNGPDIGNETGCLKDGQWCDPSIDASCTRCGIKVCSANLPPQPIGYGPPDSVRIALNDGSHCQQTSPGIASSDQVGQGRLQCGRSGPSVYFYGSSNSAVNTGHVHVNGKTVRCNNGKFITGYYDGYFDFPCIRDTQGNATCTYDQQINVPLIGFSVS